MNRIILHVDMDAFYAAVEQRDHPEWRGKPVIVGAGPTERGVVSTASYEARKFGVKSAMPSRTAARLCPHGIFVTPNMKRYGEVSEQVFALLEGFTPLIEPVSVDEAFLDVSGATRLFGDGPTIANAIRHTIRESLQLTASVGVATNKFLAKLSSDMNKPDGVTVVPRDPDEIVNFLAPLPVGKLWGVGTTTRATLEKHGLTTIGRIQAIALTKLSALLPERTARHFKALAMGEDDRPVEPRTEELSISREHTFDQDVDDRDVIHDRLLMAVANVGRRLRRAGKRARVVHIKVRWKNFETITRQKTLPEAVCDDDAIRRACLELWAAVPMAAPVRLIGMGVSGFNVDRDAQLTLFGEGDRSPQRRKQERLSQAVDSIRSRFGGKSILPAPSSITSGSKPRKPA